MIQESRCSSAECLCVKISHKTPVKVLAGAAVLFHGWLEKGLFLRLLTCLLAGFNPQGLLDRGPWFFARRRPPSWLCGPLHKATHKMAAAFHQSEQAREKEIENEKNRERDGWKPTCFYLILDVTSHRFCHILFIRSESLGSTHNQENEDQEPGTQFKSQLMPKLCYFTFAELCPPPYLTWTTMTHSSGLRDPHPPGLS